MPKSLKRNYILNVAYQILTILIPIVTIPYLSRVLQSEAVGVLSYSESMVSYFTLFATLGSTVYAQREIGKRQYDRAAQSRIFWEIQIVRTVSSVIAIAVYIAYTFVVRTNLIICLILGLEIFNVVVDINWFFQGLEEFGKTVIFGLCAKILNLICIFVFIKSPNDLWIYAISRCGFVVLGNLLMWVLLPKYLTKVNHIHPFSHIKVIFTFFIPAIATQVYTILDKSMIGWFTTTRVENGYYEYAEKIVRMSIVLISSLASVLIPRVAKSYADGNIDMIKGIIGRAIRFVWMFALPLMFGFIVISGVLIPIYLGENYEKCIILLQIFSLLVLFVGMANIVGLALLVPINKQSVYLLSVVISAVINVVMNLILIPHFYSIGAAISSIVAEFVGISIQIGFVLHKKLLDVKIIFLSSWKYWIAGIIMFGAVFAVKYFVPVAVWSLIVLLVVGIAVYFLTLLALRDGMLLDFLSKGIMTVKNVFKRKNTSPMELQETSFVQVGEDGNITNSEKQVVNSDNTEGSEDV